VQLVSAHPRDLDVSGPWLFWARDPSPELVSSLARLGQAVPALVDFTPDKPRLVAGYARTMALRGQKGAVLQARPVEPPDTQDAALPEEVRLGLLYLASNMERAVDESMLVAAGRFFAARLPLAEWVELAGPYLGLSPKARKTRDLAAWLALPERFDALLASGALTLASAPELARLGGEIEVLEPYLTAVRWSRNSLRNFASWLAEAALARGIPLSEAVADAGLPAALLAGLSPNDLTARLLSGARRLRYPRLLDLEERFAALSGELCRGTRLRILPSQGFESDAARLETIIGNRQQLEEILTQMRSIAARPQWEQLWSLVRDAEDGHGD